MQRTASNTPNFVEQSQVARVIIVLSVSVVKNDENKLTIKGCVITRGCIRGIEILHEVIPRKVPEKTSGVWGRQEGGPGIHQTDVSEFSTVNEVIS